MQRSASETFSIRAPWMFAAGLILVAAFCGCAGQQIPVTPKPMPAGVTYAGKWYSPQYEDMVLEQKGDVVTGTFTYRTGGTLEGKLEGHVLSFEWVQPGDMEEARREVKGSGYFYITDDGEKLVGEWGYGTERQGGGAWTADRISQKLERAVDPEESIFDN